MCSDWNHPTSELKEISLSDKSSRIKPAVLSRLGLLWQLFVFSAIRGMAQEAWQKKKTFPTSSGRGENHPERSP